MPVRIVRLLFVLLRKSLTFLILLGFFDLQKVCAAGPERGEQEVTIAEYGEYLLYAPLYIAAEKHFFEDAGLKVRIVPAGGDEKVFAALLAGDAQLGISDPTFTAISGQRGKPGRVVAAILKGVPAWGVTKNEKILAIDSPSALGNYRVATYPSPSTSYTLQKRMFELGGRTPNIAEIAYGALLPALDAKQVDIALENEPNVSLAESRGAHRVYAMHNYFPELAFTGVSILPEYGHSHPEVVKGALGALLRGAAYLIAERKESIAVLSRRFPEYPVEVISRAIERTNDIGAFSTDGRFSEAAWTNAIQLRRDVGDLREASPYDTYVDNSFLPRK